LVYFVRAGGYGLGPYAGGDDVVSATFASSFGNACLGGPLRALRAMAIAVVTLAVAACGSSTVQAPPPATQVTPEPPPLSAPAPDSEFPSGNLSITAIELGGPVKVGILLPLSGRYARIGEALLNAAQLALFDVADDEFTFVVRDTGGTPEGARLAAQTLLSENVRLILGPLFSTSVTAIADQARQARVPIITFSNDRNVAGPGIYVMGLAPQPQIDRIVGYAAQRGLSRFAVMAPSSPYGQAVVAAIQEATQRYAVALSRVVTYPPDAQDLSLEVRNLADYDQRHQALLDQRQLLAARGDDAAKLALKRLDGLETLGKPDFDAVILPEAGERLRVIAPSLAYYDVDPAEVRFLGTSLWEDASLGSEPSLLGGWFTAPQPELWETFAARYKDIFGAAPPRVTSLAYDAAALAAVLARGATESLEPFVYDEIKLAQPSGFAGIDGVFRFLPSGVIERHLAILQIERDGFKVIELAPQSFLDTGS
jgi:ABC-type branched-subunit amino acid transport system substrate-binding protein